MNPSDEAREPVSTKDGPYAEDEHVEVLVEDLFIEEYPPPAAPARGEKPGRLARAVRPLRGRGKSLLYGLFALGALAVVRLVRGEGRRRSSRVARLFHRLGLAG